MQVRQMLLASLLAVTAVGAMSQELDLGETLQGKSLAAQREQAARREQAAQASGRSRESAGVEAPAAKAAPDSQHAQDKTRSKVRFDLTRWQPAHKAVVGEQG